MTAAPPTPPLVPTPATVVIDGFVIETYSRISDVPFASVSDQRGKSAKTAEHERYDELYGRCRICMGHKSGEQLLLCDVCDRGYHMTCLIPALRDVPKGEWHCPNCTRERKYTYHARATAIANMRRVLNDIASRPTMPPRLQLKMLDIPSPVVQFSHVPACTNSTSQQLQNDTLNYQERAPNTLPPRCRLKNYNAQMEVPVEEQGAGKTILYKKVAGDSLERRRTHVSRLADDLAPVAEYFGDNGIISSLDNMQTTLEWSGSDHVEDEFVETRTSDNSFTKGKKRPRMDGEEKHAAKRLNRGENSTPPQSTPDSSGPPQNVQSMTNNIECIKKEQVLEALPLQPQPQQAVNGN